MAKRSMEKVFRGVALGSLAAAMSIAAQAATDGSLGATSTATMGVQVDIPSLVRVHGVADVDFGTYTGTAIAGQNVPFCVWGNVATYDITVSSANESAGAFRMLDSVSGDFVGYDVLFSATDDASAGAAVTSGTTISGSATASNNLAVCDTTNDNAAVFLTVPEANMQTVTPGTYNDTMTLLVEPI